MLNRGVGTGIIALALIFSAACPKGVHPNQMNEFDGKTYDSLMLAHEALATLREQVQLQHQDLIPTFNQAADSYRGAFDAYALYRIHPDTTPPQIALLTANLAVGIVALENGLSGKLPVAPEQRAAIHARARQREEHAGQQARYAISFLDILTALQMGAEMAKSIPQAGPYAALADLLIQATRAAVSAAEANASRPIELALIVPIALIPVS